MEEDADYRKGQTTGDLSRVEENKQVEGGRRISQIKVNTEKERTRRISTGRQKADRRKKEALREREQHHKAHRIPRPRRPVFICNYFINILWQNEENAGNE